MTQAPTKPRRPVSWMGAIAILTLVVAAAVVGPFLWRWIRALNIGEPSSIAAESKAAGNAEKYNEAFSAFVKQLDGRSLYYEPSAPGTEGEVVVAEEPEDDGPAPTRYDGPAIVAIVLDTVWFNDGQRIKAGSKGSGGLEVISTNAPWGARVSWHGTEFTVPFFEKDKVILKSAQSGNSSSPSSAAPTPQEIVPAMAAAETQPHTDAPLPATQTAGTPEPAPASPAQNEPSTPPANPAPTPTPDPAPTPETPR